MAGKFEFAYTLDGHNIPPAIITAPVAASQTLVNGDLVVISSGQIAKASASVAAPFGVMAQDSSSAAAGTLVRVFPIVPHTQVWKAKASAAATSAVLGAIVYDITAAQLVDIADAVNGSISIIALGRTTTDVDIVFSKTFLTSLA